MGRREILNLTDWIERRKADIGPYADAIMAGTRGYEDEIRRLRIMAYQPASRHEEGCDCGQCVPF